MTLAWRQTSQDEVADAGPEWGEGEAGVFFGGEDGAEDAAEAEPEESGGGGGEGDEQELFKEGEVLGFGEGEGQDSHR